MNDTPATPFAPFQPSPLIAPETPAKPETAKQKAAREKREVKAAEKPVKPLRKKRTPGLKAHAPKFDLQTTLAAASLLNEADFPLFEKMILALDEAGKPARDRVMAALAKVFA